MHGRPLGVGDQRRGQARAARTYLPQWGRHLPAEWVGLRVSQSSRSNWSGYLSLHEPRVVVVAVGLRCASSGFPRQMPEEAMSMRGFEAVPERPH